MTQAVEVSSSSTSVSVDTDGVGFGLGIGADIPVSRTVDLILEGAWLFVQFDEFAFLETSEVESNTRGMEFALKLGVRARIARMLSR